MMLKVVLFEHLMPFLTPGVILMQRTTQVRKNAAVLNYNLIKWILPDNDQVGVYQGGTELRTHSGQVGSVAKADRPELRSTGPT